MGLITVNGNDVFRGTLRFPRYGCWHADLKADSLTAISGPVTIQIGDGALTLGGTVSRGGEFVDVASLRVVSGAAGLPTLARAVHYVSTAPRAVVTDLLATAGETLAASADASVLDADLSAWTTTAIATGKLLARLARTLGPDVVWRALPDGTIWVGRETWPDSGLTDDDFEVMEQDDEHGFALLGVENPTLLPGTTLLGRKVSYVEYVIEDSVRMRVWYEDDGASSDRFKSALSGAVRGAVDDIDYGALYTAKLVSQAGGTVDVLPDDSRLPQSMGQVPLRLGVPGATANGASGGTVLVGWAGRDPSRPFALSFDPSTSVAQLVLAVTGQLGLGGQAGEPAPLGAQLVTYLTTLATAISALGPTVPPPPPSILSSKVMVAS